MNKLYMYISSNFFQYHICRDLGIIDVSVIFLYICTVYITLVTVPDWDEGRWDVTTSEARINGLLLTRGGRTSSEVFDLKKVNMNHYNVYQNEKQNTINTISIHIISIFCMNRALQRWVFQQKEECIGLSGRDNQHIIFISTNVVLGN